jgi:hypothetical protein
MGEPRVPPTCEPLSVAQCFALLGLASCVLIEHRSIEQEDGETGMQEADYHRYIAAFNARDYDTLETFFTDDFVLENAGFAVRGKKAFRDFYAFFHEYCGEEVEFLGFFAGQQGFVAHVIIHFTGLKNLSPQVLADRGYSGMSVVPEGVTVPVEFYIHYMLNDAGLIRYIKGAIWVPEAKG